MMRKLGQALAHSLLIMIVIVSYILMPLNVSAASKATTLAGLRQELSQLQNQKKANQNSVAATQSEINAKKTAVANAYAAIEQAEIDIGIAKQEIEASNVKISDLKDKTKELLKFYEVINNNDSYMEYVTGAATMTDLLMRLDAVNTVIDYNKSNIVELENLIEQNEKNKVDLLAKEDQLESNINDYNSKLAGLQNNLSSLLDVSMDIDDQIATQKDLITYYTNLGCKENEDLSVCESSANNAGWLKPLKKGVITSLFGYRISPITGAKSFHNGIDIGGNSEGTNLYAVGTGTVIAVVNAKNKLQTTGKKTCGGNQVYINITIAGVKYTTMYAHMLSINVNVGDTVTANTVVGYVGGGSGTKAWETCSTGAHVHFSVSKGYYSTYNSFIAGQTKPPGFPGKGGWFYSRTQWFG